MSDFNEQVFLKYQRRHREQLNRKKRRLRKVLAFVRMARAIP
ncbi:hypothetical protein [Thalassotalea sp. G20_0]|nr:hypothetical protein [Thalassotalea sp. G20_0]